jgi:hypothetical protein
VVFVDDGYSVAGAYAVVDSGDRSLDVAEFAARQTDVLRACVEAVDLLV